MYKPVILKNLATVLLSCFFGWTQSLSFGQQIPFKFYISAPVTTFFYLTTKSRIFTKQLCAHITPLKKIDRSVARGGKRHGARPLVHEVWYTQICVSFVVVVIVVDVVVVVVIIIIIIIIVVVVSWTPRDLVWNVRDGLHPLRLSGRFVVHRESRWKEGEEEGREGIATSIARVARAGLKSALSAGSV